MTAKLLIITRNFPPLTGGMEKLILHATAALAQTYCCTVIGPRGSSDFIAAPHTCIECDDRSLPRFLWQSTRAALKASRESNYALVIAGSGLIGPICWLLQKLRNLPTMIFLHGLDIVVRSLPYRLIWLPSLRRANFVVANSSNTSALAGAHGIHTPDIRIIHPGVDLANASLSTPPCGFLQELNGRPLLLSVGRIVKRKGLLEFIEKCMPELKKKVPGIVLLIIGDEPKAALKRDSGIRHTLEAAITRLSLQDSVILHGPGSDAEIQAAYAAADLFIFPLVDVSGDVEGYGMVAAEAAVHGTPTAAFRCGGVSDALVDRKTGFLVKPGDYQAMTECVAGAMRGSAKTHMAAACRQFARNKNWDRFGEKLCRFVAAAIVRSE